MTPAEIVKALRCTATVPTGDEPCESCPFNRAETLTEEQKAQLHCKEWYACDVDGIALAAANLIERLEKEKADAQWIPATERLPEDGQNVLCWYEYFRYGEYNAMFKAYGIGYQYFGNWGGEVSHGTNARVLAWLPLRKTPEVK